MDRLHRSILACLRETIVQDLDVENGVMDQLIAEYVLKDQDIVEISRGRTSIEKAEILLNILPNRGPYAFETFQKALGHHYSWLSEAMARSLTSDDTDASTTVITGEPILPPHSSLTVVRENKIQQLKSALRKLGPGGYVVIHGMKGFGRSHLTISTLTDSIMVQNLFHNQIYWVTFGNKNQLEDDILNRLNSLYHLIKNDPQVSTNDATSEFGKDELRKVLKNYFNTDPHRNSLLILDDVWDGAIIDTFDFNCKTLVITTNIDLLGDRHKQVVEMKNGFTERESLGLFAQVLEVEINDLPPEAKYIHQECNGMPILIAMYAAQFSEYKEEMRHTVERWQHYLKCLRKKDKNNEIIKNFLDKQEAIFDMCIDRLPESTKKRYRNLAIFNEDVNISSKTLEVLWGEETHSVNEQMKDLCHKSLTARQWNNELKTYIYGIHDLLICHLRKNLTPEQLSNMHKDFIEKYRSYCNGDFSLLPKDNYSFSYIGHHLEQAKMIDEFQNLYLDFNFICAKICNSGLNDLLIDLKKYRRHITKDDLEVEAKVIDLEKFLKAQVKILAEHRRRGCLDLAQIALNHNIRGYFYETAKKLAESQSTHLYLYHEQQNPKEELHNVSEVPIELTTVNFTENPNQILLGSHYGEVVLWDTKNRRRSPFLVENGTKILKVIVSQLGDFFLALNDQGVIKRFVLNHESDEDTSSDEGSHMLTPREKQPSWSGIYSLPNDQSITTYDLSDRFMTDITDIALSPDDQQLAACTRKGFFRVWDINGDISCEEQTKERPTDSVAFARNGTLLFFVDAEEGLLLAYHLARNYEHRYQSDYLAMYRPVRELDHVVHRLRGQKVIYFREIPTDSYSRIYMLLVTDLEAAIIDWEYTEQSYLVNPKTRFHVCIDSVLNPGTKFTAATLTHQDHYIVIANSEGFVKIYDLYNNIEVKALYPGKAISLDTYYLDNDSHLIIGGLNQLTYKWSFKCESNLPQSVRTPKFDALMRPVDQLDIVVQVMDKKIGVFEGDTLITETAPIVGGDIIDLDVCKDGEQIIYVVKTGHLESFTHEIRHFNYRTKTERVIQKLYNYKGPIKFLEINGSHVPVWKEGDNLKIAMSRNVWSDAKSTGNVINLHTIDNKYVVTVADTGKIIIWEIIDSEWRNIQEIPGNMIPNVCFSRLNAQEDVLTLLKSGGEMRIYIIENRNTRDGGTIEMKESTKQNFMKPVTCCSFSPDGRFLAVGMDDGLINIYDICSDEIHGVLSLHCYSVLQLHWAPEAIGAQILLSVNCEDIAWWNISLLDDEKKMKRRSRTGLSRSSTTPTIGMSPRGSMRMSASQSAAANLSDLTEKLENNGIEERDDSDQEETRQFWSSKVAKYNNKPGLLGFIQLPHSCRPKVCVSSDFKKFLLVDIHGSINTYKLFGL